MAADADAETGKGRPDADDGTAPALFSSRFIVPPTVNSLAVVLGCPRP